MHDGRRVLAGRYELGAVLGRGGMGTVHRATDLILERTVAVKLLPAALAAEDASHVTRFEREARAAASLTHPGVVAIYDSGEDEATRFIVMECVEGRSLSEVLREDAPLQPARAAAIASRVAGALAAAHAAGIIHRDVKPGNVMLADDGAVKVLDFGIARSLDGSTLTQNAAVLGTAGYMAPEQALGERADERSDIYSLGCLLYALLTGSPPFSGDAAAAVAHQHVNSAPRPPSAGNRAVSPALDALVMQMLAKSPDARPQSAAELQHRLDALQAAPRRPRLDPRPATARAAPAEPTASTRVLGAGRRAGRPRAAAAAALAAGIIAIVAIVALASGAGSSGPSKSSRRAASSKPNLASARAAAPAPTRAATTPKPAPSTTPGATTQSAKTPQVTVAAAAGSLSSLLAQAAQSGALDQKAARQMTGGLEDVLHSYEAGRPVDAQRAVLDLSRGLTALQEQGRVSPTAAAPLAAAVAGLGSALATPQAGAAQAAQPETPATAPGQDGEAPGKGAKHGDGHKHGAGD
ncbi:MAG: serine/threonine protein kinase [Solirubrobacterales bacterium]|nr:serine/threonine protein kinase [Solirubrobacterales bacterium]